MKSARCRGRVELLNDCAGDVLSARICYSYDNEKRERAQVREPLTFDRQGDMLEGKIAQKGIAALQDAMFEAYTFWGYVWIPYHYSIDGIVFHIGTYKNARNDDCEMGLNFIFPVNVDPLNNDDMIAVQAAFWLYHQIDYLNDTLMFLGSHGFEEKIIGTTSEDLYSYLQRIVGLRDLPIYPYLPSHLWTEIYNCGYYCVGYWRAALAREREERLLAMRSSTNYGYVYLIQSPTGAYKIGRTKDPSNRMKTFTVKLPFEVDYVCVIETADMYTLEGDLHLRFNSKRVNGEWFRLEPQDVEHIKELAGAS